MTDKWTTSVGTRHYAAPSLSELAWDVASDNYKDWERMSYGVQYSLHCKVYKVLSDKAREH